MDPLPIGTAGVTPLSVANIDNPSAELNLISGARKGDMRLCYKTQATYDSWTLYAWDDADAAAENVPYSVNGLTGRWISVGGKYNKTQFFVESDINCGGDLFANSGDDATSTTTGALAVIGGAGLTKALWVGGLVNIAGVLTAAGTTEATSVSAAAVVDAGGLGVAKRSFLGSIASTFKGNVLAGVQDGTAVVAGQVGEALSSVVSAVTVTGSGTAGNVTSLAVTAGAWHLYAFGVVNGGATGLTSGSTAKLSIVTGTATNGTSGATMAQQSVLALLANDLFSLSVLPIPVVITGTITYYLTEEVTFAAGTPTVSGTLAAIRIR